MTRYLKNMEKEIIIDNQLDEVARIALFIEELGISLQLPASITMSLNLAIEAVSYTHLTLPTKA